MKSRWEEECMRNEMSPEWGGTEWKGFGSWSPLFRVTLAAHSLEARPLCLLHCVKCDTTLG